MKKIGIIYLGKKGGPTVDTLEMCKALIEKKDLYIVLSKQIENLEEYKQLESQNPGKITILTINTYNNKIDFLLKTLNVLRFLIISNKIKKQKLDFIYFPMVTYWGALLSMFLKKQKLVTAIHDPECHIGEENSLFEKLTKINVKNSQNLVVFSKKFIKPVSNKYSFPIEKICELKLGGYSYYLKKKSNENVNVNVKNNKILFFGRISKYKGLQVLLEAVKEMRNSGSKVVVKVVGNGKLTEKEQLLVSELGSGVELINRWIKDEEIEDFFSDIDFTVLPYIQASQSGVVMLSYAMKKAVLATDVGALDEQVLDDSGIIVEPKNVDALIDGIQKLYDNNSFISKGERGYYYATKEWTWEKQAQRLIDFLK